MRKIVKLTLIFLDAWKRDSEYVGNFAHANIDKTDGWPSRALFGSTSEKCMRDHFRVSGFMIVRVHDVDLRFVFSTRKRIQTYLLISQLRKNKKEDNKQKSNQAHVIFEDVSKETKRIFLYKK